jgi:alpha-tubulin suppressor-like RCC1 family protein
MPIPRYFRWLVGPVLTLLLLASAIWAAPTVTDAEESETGLDGIVAVANEACHSLVLRVDGTVWGWGCNSDWDLGATAPDGDDSTSTPIQATGLDQVRALAFGYGHALAVRADGTVWAWGENDHGQVGSPTDGCPFHNRPCSQVPIPVPGLSGMKAVAATDYSSFALEADGTVWAWGQGLLGELGTGATEDNPSPLQVDGLTNIVTISAAGNRVVALGADGTVWQWGGDLGASPTPVAGLEDPVTVAAGDVRNLALMADGTVWTWGEEDAPALNAVAGLGPMTAITGGGKLSAALAADGRVWVWGRPTSTGPPEEPSPVEDLHDVIAISMGTEGDLVALKADGSVWTWRQYSTVHPVPAPASATPTP